MAVVSLDYWSDIKRQDKCILILGSPYSISDNIFWPFGALTPHFAHNTSNTSKLWTKSCQRIATIGRIERFTSLVVY